MRSVDEIFAELETICTSSGYVHALAYMCFRDNMMGYLDEITPADMTALFRPDRLIRTETSALVGLMLKGDRDSRYPGVEKMREHVLASYTLLEEMHEAMLGNLNFSKTTDPASIWNSISSGLTLREPMFYGGESAYSFQFRDLSEIRFDADTPWFLEKKRISPADCRSLARAIQQILNQKLTETLELVSASSDHHDILLEAFIFTTEELVDACGLEEQKVSGFLALFSFPAQSRNDSFGNIHDYNAYAETPLIQLESRRFLQLEQYTLLQSLYESPFFWMCSDKTYQPIAMRNRGQFTEEFSRSRLALVFGEKNVHKNVDIFRTKGERVGEIDVLVFLGNRAIVVQAKSKRLTLEAKRGNEVQIRKDFAGAIQRSYDQAVDCADALTNAGEFKFMLSSGRELNVPSLKRIYPICIVADHYPALAFQASQFLIEKQRLNTSAPFIMDVFTLDTMTELLDSSLRLLSYIDRRTKYSGSINAAHELTILSYHLKTNLWMDGSFDLLQIGDDVSADLDCAMTVRRENIPGQRTPDGILTQFKDTRIERMLETLGTMDGSAAVELGLMLQTLSGKTLQNINAQLDGMLQLAYGDRRHHDFTMPMFESAEGLTVHTNYLPNEEADRRLRQHCEWRKYKAHVGRWFGLLVQPKSGEVRLCMLLEYEWHRDASMEIFLKQNPGIGRLVDISGTGKRISAGRNDPCPCGSSLKYKKCCL